MRRMTGYAVALVLCAGAAVSPAASGAPRGVHVALGADPMRSATVAWLTDGLTDPGSTVEFGPTEELGRSVAGRSVKANGVNVLAHEALLTGLEPGAAVYYRAGGDSGFSPVRSFRTAPAGRDGFRFTLFADHGNTANSEATTARIVAAEPDLHIAAGDLSYAQPSTPTFTNHKEWDTWFDKVEPLASRVPLMVAPGNHENEVNGGTDSYRQRFALPGAELYYSFDYENVHFLILTSDRSTLTTGDGILADMLAFAEQDLMDASARRAAGDIDFIVVVQHHPLYGWQSGSPEGWFVERHYNTFLIAAQEQMLQRYGVDMLLTGHNHHYQRSKPVRYAIPTTEERSSYADPDGFIQVISGGGGQSINSFYDAQNPPMWSAALAARYSFVQFDVAGDVLTGRAIATDTGAVLDSWTLRAA